MYSMPQSYNQTSRCKRCICLNAYPEYNQMSPTVPCLHEGKGPELPCAACQNGDSHYANDSDTGYVEQPWGTYKVITRFTSRSGTRFLVRYVCIHNGESFRYQRHSHREEIWTIMDGTDCSVLDGKTKVLQGGDVVHIHKGQKHAIKAVTALELIELQIGDDLSEDDIECFEWIWS